MELAVGYVAGLIALGIFLARQLVPNALSYILSSILGDVNTAATWTAGSSILQQSYWPSLLRTDTAFTRGVRPSVVWISRYILTTGIILSIASIITPLGLYSVLVPGRATEADFEFAVDDSPFGWGTMPREHYRESRTCGKNLLTGALPCPFTNDAVTMDFYPNSSVIWESPSGINVTVPSVLRNAYSSGTRNDASRDTVSNFFDIQFRQYMKVSEERFNNGSEFTVAGYRNLQSLVLNNRLEAVEGLIVDTVTGRIGFRNHTVPVGQIHGAEWEEDILFIEPETVCVDTNLTLDYTYKNTNSSGMSKSVLTDRGGFVNLNHTFPDVELPNRQKDLDLRGKAYVSAWLHNALVAMFLNVTHPKIADSAPFSYMKSALNQTFSLDVTSSLLSEAVKDIRITTDYSDIFELNMEGYTNASTPGLSSNIYNINSNNFTLAGKRLSQVSTSVKENTAPYANCPNAKKADWCRGGNMSSVDALSDQVLVACGLMRGIPKRQDPGQPFSFESGSNWSQPLYSCASAVKASIKTVSLSYNGTLGRLAGLQITGVREKKYPSRADIPLWGVENTTSVWTFNFDQVSLLWGLVAPEYEHRSTVTTYRQPSLYLAGMADMVGTSIGSMSSGENLAAADFAAPLLLSAYCVGARSGQELSDTGTGLSGTCKGFNYQGAQSIAMFAKWQNLTANAQSASRVPNLIFTDIVANALVGTKARTTRHGTDAAPARAKVTPIVSATRYRTAFAVPAIIAAVAVVLSIVAASIFALVGRGGLSTTRLHIHRLAPGRIYTMHSASGAEGLNRKISGKEWSASFGLQRVDLSRPAVGELQQERIHVAGSDGEEDVSVTTRLHHASTSGVANPALVADSRKKTL